MTDKVDVTGARETATGEKPHRLGKAGTNVVTRTGAA